MWISWTLGCNKQEHKMIQVYHFFNDAVANSSIKVKQGGQTRKGMQHKCVQVRTGGGGKKKSTFFCGKHCCSKLKSILSSHFIFLW